MSVSFIEWVWVILYCVCQENCCKVPITKVSLHTFTILRLQVCDWHTVLYLCNLQVCYIRLHMLNILNVIIFACNKHLTPPQNTGSQEAISNTMIGSGPRYQILSHIFARCTSKNTHCHACQLVFWLAQCARCTLHSLHVALFAHCISQKTRWYSVTQIIYLGPLPNFRH